MTAIIFLVEQLALGLYVLFAVGIILNVWKLFASRAEYRATPFELEREMARYRQANALTMIVVLLELMVIVSGVQFRVAPYVRSHYNVSPRSNVQIQDGVFNTPTPAPLTGDLNINPVGNLAPDDPIAQVLATPTLTPTPVGTIIPNSPPAIGCDTPNATLQIPANGMQVFEPIVVRGTAFIDNFSLYKIEIEGPSTFGNFVVIDQKSTEVLDTGELSQFVPSKYEPGDYRFRLTVFDATTALRASCMVNILITEPVPTPTPLGQ